jgi:hypothetical protein
VPGVQAAIGGGWIPVLKDAGVKISMDCKSHRWMPA